MTENTSALKPPYATYSRFIKFFENLGDEGIPSRIDASIFGNASGSFTYAMLRALEFLGFIDDDGHPTGLFNKMVAEVSNERGKAIILQDTLRRSYPTLFSNAIDLSRATQGQFDSLLRETYGVSGSTVDKVAAFFLSAAKDADIDLSKYLKQRRSVGPSKKFTERAKPAKKRKPETSTPPSERQQPKITEKALEYRLVDLMSEAGGDVEVMDAIVTLIKFLKMRDDEDD